MLNRLRAQFVAAATLALMLALAMIMVIGYYMAAETFEAQINMIIDALLRNEGEMPEVRMEFEPVGRLVVTQEQQYETRFFSVILDGDGQEVYANTRWVVSVDDRQAGIRKGGSIMTAAFFITNPRYGRWGNDSMYL